MPDQNRPLVETLFLRYRSAIRTYLYRRVRTKADVPDLVQEVYLRMLRVADTAIIRDPQLYLYSVAKNLLREHAAFERRRAGHADIDDVGIQLRLGELPPLDVELDTRQTATNLQIALNQLPSRWRTALILQTRYGLTYKEIGDRLGVSSNMVKKYLARGAGRLRFLLTNLDQ